MLGRKKPKEKEGREQINFLESEELMSSANMPRCLQQGVMPPV